MDSASHACRSNSPAPALAGLAPLPFSTSRKESDVPTLTEPEAASTAAETYYEIQDFYARQMQLLDQGYTQEWAQTFTEDGVFAANAQPEPVRTRSAIAAGAAAASAELSAQGIRRRHWLGMVSALPPLDRTVRG